MKAKLPPTRIALATVLCAMVSIISACQSTPNPSRAFDASGGETQATGGLRRQYVDGRFGQIHVHVMTPPTADDAQVPLVAFHSTAMSGDYFREFMLELGQDRVVIAPDTPGYGYSDRPPEPQSIAELAGAAADALDALGYGSRGKGAVDVLGYHTGTFIAIELAVLRPDLVRRLVLPGIPYFSGQQRIDALASNTKPKPYLEDGTYIAKRWQSRIKRNQNIGLPLERNADFFAAYLLAGEDRWWAYYGVFSYDAEARLPQVQQPVLIPHVGDGLRAYTDAAAALLPNVTIVDLPEIKNGVFHRELPTIAPVIRSFLDQ